MFKELNNVFTDEDFLNEMYELSCSNLNTYELAKHQEKLICKYSDHYFMAVDPGENHINDLHWGDIYAWTDGYIDIKIGYQQFAGCINKSSIDNFEGSLYVCVSGDLKYCYLIVPETLRELIKSGKIKYRKSKFKGKPDYIGELDFKDYFQKIEFI